MGPRINLPLDRNREHPLSWGNGLDDVLSLEYEYRWHPQDLPDPAVGFKDSALALRRMLATVVPA